MIPCLQVPDEPSINKLAGNHGDVRHSLALFVCKQSANRACHLAWPASKETETGRELPASRLRAEEVDTLFRDP